MAANTKPDSNQSEPKEAKTYRLNGLRQDKFLAFLAESSNVSKSARKAEISLSEAYKLRRKNPEFARKWLSALWEGYTHLEMEVLRRLRDGDQKTDAEDKYDFANAIRLLAAHRDNAAKAQASQRNVSAAEVRDSIDRKVKAIREQVRNEKLAAKADCAKALSPPESRDT